MKQQKKQQQQQQQQLLMKFKIVTKKRNLQESSTYSWSSVSQSLDIHGENRSCSDDESEEEPWWESFKSQPSTQTSS